MVEGHSSTGMGKSGKWSNHRIILSIDWNVRTITIPAEDAKDGGRATVAIKDARLALHDDLFARAVQSRLILLINRLMNLQQ